MRDIYIKYGAKQFDNSKKEKKGKNFSQIVPTQKHRCRRDIPVPSLKCKREAELPRWREGCSSISEELLRVAYVTAVPFIPRFIFLAPCSPSPPSSSFLFLRWKRPTNPRRPSTVKRGTAIPTESKKKEEEIFLHTRWGVIARHNVTNFQLLRGSPSLPHPPPPKRCPNAHLNRPRSHPSPPPPPFPSPLGGSTLAKGTAMGWDGVPPFPRSMVDRHDRPGTDFSHAQFTVSHFIPIARSTTRGWRGINSFHPRRSSFLSSPLREGMSLDGLRNGEFSRGWFELAVSWQISFF